MAGGGVVCCVNRSLLACSLSFSVLRVLSCSLGEQQQAKHAQPDLVGTRRRGAKTNARDHKRNEGAPAFLLLSSQTEKMKRGNGHRKLTLEKKKKQRLETLSAAEENKKKQEKNPCFDIWRRTWTLSRALAPRLLPAEAS